MSSKYDEEGEDGTGFAKGDGKGEFNCGNCVHMQKDDEANGCMHPIMMSLSKLKRNRENYPIVDHDDCCRYVKRPTKKS